MDGLIEDAKEKDRIEVLAVRDRSLETAEDASDF